MNNPENKDDLVASWFSTRYWLTDKSKCLPRMRNSYKKIRMSGKYRMAECYIPEYNIMNSVLPSSMNIKG